MIRICRYCSNVDIEFVAYINDELIETSTEEELLDYIKRI